MSPEPFRTQGSGGRDAPPARLSVSVESKERNVMSGTTLTRIRRRRVVRAIEVAVLGFVMSLLALSLERSLVGRGGNSLQPALR